MKDAGGLFYMDALLIETSHADLFRSRGVWNCWHRHGIYGSESWRHCSAGMRLRHLIFTSFVLAMPSLT